MTALSFPIDLTPDYAIEHALEEQWGDEAKCELNHSGTACSVSVTAIFRSCIPSQLVCAKAATDLSESIASGVSNCICGRPVTSHWVVIPV